MKSLFESKKMQALLRRLPVLHPKYPLIQEALAKCIAGYKGEHSIDYPLSFLPEKQYFILHDLRLKDDQNHHFQIDSLLLSKNFILRLDVKNMGGVLFFDPHTHQIIQTYNGKEKAYSDPLIQQERHKQQLKQWIQKYNLPPLPILSLVVFSNPNALLRTTPENKQIFQFVIHRDYLPTKVEMLEKKNQEEVWTKKEIKKASRLLLKQDEPLDQSLLEKYNINKAEMLSGVHCPKCEHLPLERIHGSWYCSVCDLSHKHAHEEALKDYSLLIGSSIKNSEARNFLGISSPSTVKRLLQSLNLETSGGNKNKTYHLFFQD